MVVLNRYYCMTNNPEHGAIISANTETSYKQFIHLKKTKPPKSHKDVSILATQFANCKF